MPDNLRLPVLQYVLLIARLEGSTVMYHKGYAVFVALVRNHAYMSLENNYIPALPFGYVVDIGCKLGGVTAEVY